MLEKYSDNKIVSYLCELKVLYLQKKSEETVGNVLRRIDKK